MNGSYIQIVRSVIEKIEKTQAEVIDEVANLCVDSIKKKHMLYFFGTGHSHMICEEPFYRAGGLVPVHPILEPALMLHEGAYKSTLFERLDGIGKVLLDVNGAEKGDVLFLISKSGRNGSVIDMAFEARNKNITTVAIPHCSIPKPVHQGIKAGRNYTS